MDYTTYNEDYNQIEQSRLGLTGDNTPLKRPFYNRTRILTPDELNLAELS